MSINILTLKIVLSTVGIMLLSFSYLILFKHKYSLIKDFNEAFKAGLKTEHYANRVGLFEFIAGIVVLIIAIFLIIFV